MQIIQSVCHGVSVTASQNILKNTSKYTSSNQIVVMCCGAERRREHILFGFFKMLFDFRKLRSLYVVVMLISPSSVVLVTARGISGRFAHI